MKRAHSVATSSSGPSETKGRHIIRIRTEHMLDALEDHPKKRQRAIDLLKLNDQMNILMHPFEIPHEEKKTEMGSDQHGANEGSDADDDGEDSEDDNNGQNDNDNNPGNNSATQDEGSAPAASGV